MLVRAQALRPAAVRLLPLALLALLAAAALPQPAAAVADTPLTESVVYAETNRGLFPERFRAYGIMHYAQMYQPVAQSKGTIVSARTEVAAACGCCRVVAAAGRCPYNPC